MINELTTRQSRQAVVMSWAIKAFGIKHCTSLDKRAIRFLEEAIELYQACDGDKEQAHKLLDYIFSNPVGDIKQEVGGVSTTLLALGECANINVDEQEVREINRVLRLPIEHFIRRNKEKDKLGFKEL